MEIKATSKFDYETIRTFYYMSIKRRVILETVFFAVLEAIIILEMFLFGISSVLCGLAIGIPVGSLIVCLLRLLGVKSYYKSYGKMKNVKNEYTFLEDSFCAVSNNEGMCGESETKYSMIEKVIEKPDYIYIFQTKRQAIIVDKSTITGGTVEDIRNKLMPILQKKYYCKFK